MMEEIWKDIAGYEGKYQVSNMGRVRSLPRVALDTKGRRQQVKGIILKPNDRKGYDSVRLRGNGCQEVFSVHRLVGMAFVPGYFDGAVINHKDENPKNNRADNLEWVTISENNHYGNHVERTQRANIHNRREVVQMDMTGWTMAWYHSLNDASEATGLHNGHISNVCRGRQPYARNYKFKFNEKTMSDKVKQAIHVGRHVTDLMRLPCVYSCHKEADGTLCYLLYDWDEKGQYVKAHEGQWLCEDYDGKWTVTDNPPAL